MGEHSKLKQPHGGEFINGLVRKACKLELQTAAREWPSWTLAQRQLGDLARVPKSVRLRICVQQDAAWERTALADPSRTWVKEELAHRLGAGSRLLLRDTEGVLLAVLNVEDVWELNGCQSWYVGGAVEGLSFPLTTISALSD